MLKILLLSVLAVAMIGLTAPDISAQTIPLILILDPLQSNVQEGDIITFSGVLLTSDQQFFIPDAEICIYDDVDFGSDTFHGCTITDSQSGEFGATLIAEQRFDGGAYDFYAVFEGDVDLESARSQTYSVTVNPIITTQDTLLILDPLQSNVQEGDIITFSGVLLTSDQQFSITGAEICFYEDVDFGTDAPLGCTITDSQSGKFIAQLVAEGRNDGWSTSFYAKFEGEDGVEPSRSQTFSVKIDPAPKSISHITLDPFDKLVDIGTPIIFTGSLEIENGNPAGKTIEIRDGDVLDLDDVLATTTVNSDGSFQATWIVKDMDSNDRKLMKTLSNLYVPIVAPSIVSFLTGYENDTVEIFAEFKGDETSKGSDTCTVKSFTVPNYDGTSMTKQQQDKFCGNNQLVISGLDPSANGLVKSLIFSQLVGGMGVDSNIITSFTGDGEITQNESLELKDMLLGLEPVKEKISGKSDMSLEEILNLIENPTSVIEKKINEKIDEKIDEKVNDTVEITEEFIETKPSISTSPNLEINSDKEYYQVGDTVWIDGVALSDTSSVNFKVIDPDGNLIKMFQSQVERGNLFDTSFEIQKEFFPLIGSYDIIAWQSSVSEDMDVLTINIGIQKGDVKKSGVPTWIKNNAGWWAEGQIDDNSFVKGIEYLVKVGIIQVS